MVIKGDSDDILMTAGHAFQDTDLIPDILRWPNGERAGRGCTIVAGRPIRQVLLAEREWHICVTRLGTNHTPDVHRVPNWERLANCVPSLRPPSPTYCQCTTFIAKRIPGVSDDSLADLRTVVQNTGEPKSMFFSHPMLMDMTKNLGTRTTLRA